MGKKFVGLDGLKHFWTKAKTWIAGQITAEVTAKIAEIVANAPEDLDTLKEIADWIKTHANDASAMNTAILANTEAISGKADKSHTHTKSEIIDFDHTDDYGIYIPNPTYNGISYVIPRYRVQSIKEVSGVPVEGKTIKIKFKLYKYASSYDIQLSYGTTDAVIQQMSGVGRTWFILVNASDTGYAIDGDWKIYEKSITIPPGNTSFGIGANIEIGIQTITIA